ncbi:MAG: hypothetical protein Q9185_003649 [Variospora sp. 1 TL-2023]
MTDGNRKLLYNVSDGIEESFSRFQPPNVGGKALMEQNINVWELLQPEEKTLDEDRLLAGLDKQRWITIEKDDAGEEDETHDEPPYMLILSTNVGESQAKVTISNQSGTTSMTKDFTPDDLQDIASTSPTPGDCENKEGIQLNFGRMNVPITLTTGKISKGS